MRKVVVIASASGSGKTTLGRVLAERLGVPFVELDELVHGPNWEETSNEELRARLEPLLAGDGWVTDGAYEHKLGDFVLDRADTVVWLDLPLHVWLPRLTRRTWRRLRGREQLWNGNRESPKSDTKSGFHYPKLTAPLRVSPSDFVPLFQGVPPTHAFARRLFSVQGRRFMLWVQFGRREPESLLTEANAVLRTIQFSRRSA
jgi:hypothetical protein